MSLDWLTAFKNFLADRPEWAFLAVSMMVNGVLFRMLVKSYNARLDETKQMIPIAERLTKMVGTAATRARSRRELPTHSTDKE